jgi:predicted transcriptional regulator of viral defense system
VKSNDLAALPPTFTYQQARAAGLAKRRLYELRDKGDLELVSRGMFHQTALPWDADIDLIEIALRARDATICLASALARYGLTDMIPATIDIAVPRNSWRPIVSAPVTWHVFHEDTFTLGRDTLALEPGTSIGIYNPQRCIIDAFRLRHREGTDLANGALRRWLRGPGNHPSTLLDLAVHFPKSQPALRAALEVLLG